MSTPTPDEARALLRGLMSSLLIIKDEYSELYDAGYSQTVGEPSEVRAKGKVSNPTCDIVLSGARARNDLEKAFKHLFTAEQQLRASANIIARATYGKQGRYVAPKEKAKAKAKA